mmetsp:Transcript_39307/g.76934  ORF Transcript_39307/g.76934 Transcript_39307/m.76934 type:complete len:204 (+) Transcript_39307:922-1533(+)
MAMQMEPSSEHDVATMDSTAPTLDPPEMVPSSLTVPPMTSSLYTSEKGMRMGTMAAIMAWITRRVAPTCLSMRAMSSSHSLVNSSASSTASCSPGERSDSMQCAMFLLTASPDTSLPPPRFLSLPMTSSSCWLIMAAPGWMGSTLSRQHENPRHEKPIVSSQRSTVSHSGWSCSAAHGGIPRRGGRSEVWSFVFRNASSAAVD